MANSFKDATRHDPVKYMGVELMNMGATLDSTGTKIDPLEYYFTWPHETEGGPVIIKVSEFD